MNRRDLLSAGIMAIPGAAIVNSVHAAEKSRAGEKGSKMKIQYLEVVTKNVDAVCSLYSQIYDISFGKPDENLGNARTAKLTSGGMIGIRAPMHAGERSVVRPYVLVKDINAAVAAAIKAGAETLVPPMEIPGHGTCAILYEGEIESGLWQL